MSASSPPAEAIQRFRDLMRQSQQLVSKISELEMERNEHKLVEDTLRPLDPSRRAFRLVGGVLVERNVGEVLPSIQQSRENVSTSSVLVLIPQQQAYHHSNHPSLNCFTQLEQTITALREKLEESQKEANDIKVKYNLQVESPR